jgi:hypothetical protein
VSCTQECGRLASNHLGLGHRAVTALAPPVKQSVRGAGQIRSDRGYFPPVMAIDHRLEIPAKMRRSIGKCRSQSLIVRRRCQKRLRWLTCARRSILTMFHLLGYKYATAAAGHLIGRAVLGEFYRLNAGRPRKEILANAWPHFREFGTISRPLLHAEVGYQSTVRDRRVLVCYTTSGRIWAQIVLVRTANQIAGICS